MLLGEIVAISFASNIFFITVLCSSEMPLSRKSNEAVRKTQWSTFALVISLSINILCIYYVPESIGTRLFLPILGLPHILLFVPLYISEESQKSSWFSVRPMVVLCAVALQAKATQDALSAGVGVKDIIHVLYEHPAVSSVGWDVIFCWTSFGLWTLLGV
jgi:hypothetical protein